MANILTVDDDAAILRLLARYLESAGHACLPADGVPAAKAVLAETPIDLILSDVDMPGESGFDLIRIVNADFPDVPIVMVSVIDNPNKARDALEMGVYGYVVKPFTRNIVLITVENALARKRLEKERKTHLESLEQMVVERTRSLNDQLTFMQKLSDAIPNPIYYKNRQGVFELCNTAFEAFTGLDQDAIIGRTAAETIPHLLADRSAETDRDLLNQSGMVSYEYDIQRADGSVQSFLINKASISDTHGAVSGLVGVVVDISKRKAFENALRESEIKFRGTFDQAAVGIAHLAPDGTFLRINQKFCDIVGYAPEEMLSLRFQEITHADDLKEDLRSIQRLLDDEIENYSTQKRYVRKDQAVVWINLTVSLVRKPDGQPDFFISVIEDITEKLTLETELQQAQKLEAIGQLAAGIAHEINTPIQYVGDNTRFLEDAFADLSAALTAYDRLLVAVADGTLSAPLVAEVRAAVDGADIPYLIEEIPSAVEQSLEGIHRVSKIVRAMRAFSHPGTDRKETVDLNQSIESTITVARNEWKYVAEMVTDLGDDIPVVPCYPGEMNQVFLNLIINAAHAISDATDGGRQGKGAITVSTRCNGDWVCINVRDTGTGIPEKVRDRIFDPFFTTKAVGRGTGQGLAIARNVVVEKHGGTLRFDTERGRGTTFIIELPLNPGDQTGAPDEA